MHDFFFCRPGDDVKITFPTAGSPPTAVNDELTVVDLYESKMSEYDASLVHAIGGTAEPPRHDRCPAAIGGT